MEVFKGAVLNIKFGAFYVFSRVFFTPLRYDYPSDVTLVLWQYGSRIRGGLLYYVAVRTIVLSRHGSNLARPVMTDNECAAYHKVAHNHNVV